MTTSRHDTTPSPEIDAILGLYARYDALASDGRVAPILTELTPRGEQLLDDTEHLLRIRRYQAEIEDHIGGCLQEVAALTILKDGR